MTATQWIEKMNAIGITSKAGRYKCQLHQTGTWSDGQAEVIERKGIWAASDTKERKGFFGWSKKSIDK